MEESKNEISASAAEKINLYVAAMYLYSQGKSHPQVVFLLSKICLDKVLLVKIADKAMKDEWDKLYEMAREMFASGLTYDKVLSEIKKKEEDSEVADLLVEKWYSIKTQQMEMIVEAPANIAEGMNWMLISGLALTILFVLSAGMISKILWSIVFVGSIIQWMLGIEQRKFSKKIEMLFQTDLVNEQ